MNSQEYVVLGAGITGLYTVYHLIHTLNIEPSKITIIAQYFPGDLSAYYTSPWAGGNFSGITSSDDEILEFDKYTYNNLHKVKEALGGNGCGLDYRPTSDYWDVLPDPVKIASLKTYMKDFKIIPQSDLPSGCKFGSTATIWNFNCPLFIEKLINYFTKIGVQSLRKTLTHVSQAYLVNETKVVFNCTGLGARSIGGVKDPKMYPTRGQVVVLRAPHIQENKMRWGNSYATYIIPRPDSNGELILGGYLQKDRETGDVFKDETDSIISRTTALLPAIKDKPLDVLRVCAGLRPSRHGGPRIESEIVEDGKVLVHYYGVGGFGYQAGLGMALKAVNLYKREVLKHKSKL